MNIEKEYNSLNGNFLNKFENTSNQSNMREDFLREIVLKNGKKLRKTQKKMYAHSSKGILIIFQAMDTGGKDSMISHILREVNPQGCFVASFKEPTPKELSHDYLWRAHKSLAGRGYISVFNRSYYEDVLVCRVHPKLITDIKKGEQFIEESFFDKRFKDIRSFENFLRENGYLILKFFLNISKNEQKKRIIRRMELTSRQWKFSPSDISERKYWDDYQKYYKDMISNTSTKSNPWYVIPSDDKWYSRACVSEIIKERIKELSIEEYPSISQEKVEILRKYRKNFHF